MATRHLAVVSTCTRAHAHTHTHSCTHRGRKRDCRSTTSCPRPAWRDEIDLPPADWNSDMKPQFTWFIDSSEAQLLGHLKSDHSRRHSMSDKPCCLDAGEAELRVSKGFSQVPEFLSCWGRRRGGKGAALPRRLEARIPPAACGRVISSCLEATSQSERRER